MSDTTSSIMPWYSDGWCQDSFTDYEMESIFSKFVVGTPWTQEPKLQGKQTPWDCRPSASAPGRGATESRHHAAGYRVSILPPKVADKIQWHDPTPSPCMQYSLGREKDHGSTTVRLAMVTEREPRANSPCFNHGSWMLKEELLKPVVHQQRLMNCGLFYLPFRLRGLGY